MKSGTLYLVATPIGNLEDISLRALRILREVDLIACEDTRHSARLLSHYGISTPRESYHQHNEASRASRLVEMLRAGRQVALVSDAGMPLVSDPGYLLVAACRREGIPVVALPGPSAAVTALAGSGLQSDCFYFAGFLPPRAAARRRRLEELSAIRATLILFEAPHRIAASLQDMLQVLGPRQACLARELTKLHEEWLTGTLQEILDSLRARDTIQGEITLVISRGESAPRETARPGSISDHLDEVMRKTGSPPNEALRSVARQRGISRREAYRLLLREKAKQSPE
jgi:16S rRNA (cytidine1402-2'-O)-methyltransferase